VAVAVAVAVNLVLGIAMQGQVVGLGGITLTEHLLLFRGRHIQLQWVQVALTGTTMIMGHFGSRQGLQEAPQGLVGVVLQLVAPELAILQRVVGVVGVMGVLVGLVERLADRLGKVMVLPIILVRN